MNTIVDSLTLDGNFPANVANLCAQRAVQNLKLASAFAVPGTNQVMLIFVSV